MTLVEEFRDLLYRPEGWEELKQSLTKNMDGHDVFSFLLGLEAGADAMLEGLKRRGEYHKQVDNDRNGWLVFIPEATR